MANPNPMPFHLLVTPPLPGAIMRKEWLLSFGAVALAFLGSQAVLAEQKRRGKNRPNSDEGLATPPLYFRKRPSSNAIPISAFFHRLVPNCYEMA